MRKVKTSGARPCWFLVLDEVLQSLPDADRHMIRLRFFDGKSFPQIGTGLGKSEAAAQSQCERALERPCCLLRRKGVAVPVTVLASGLAANATQAVPAALAAAISQGAVAGASKFALKTILIRPLEIMTQANIRGWPPCFWRLPSPSPSNGIKTAASIMRLPCYNPGPNPSRGKRRQRISRRRSW